MLKASENPPIIHPAREAVGSLSGTWWVAHTKARCEKAFAWDLHKADVAYFLPMMERITFSGGRKRLVMSPLFPSYVFFCGGAEARHRAMLTGRLCQVIPVPDQHLLLRELEQIECVLSGDVELDAYSFAVVGRRCRVKAGPFEGVEGTVIERGQTSTLVLQISLLGQAVSLQIDTSLLEAANAEAEIVGVM